MHEHLSSDLVDRYQQNRLSPLELTALLARAADCTSCSDRLAGRPLSDSLARLRAALHPEEHEHLMPDELTRWAAQSLPLAEGELVEAKIAGCPVCRDDAMELQAFRDTLAREAAVAPHHLSTRPMFGWAVAAVLAIVVLFAGYQVSHRHPVHATRTPVASQRTVQPAGVVPAHDSGAQSAEPLRFALRDGGHLIGLDAHGSLIGGEGLDPALSAVVGQVLRGEAVALPPAVEGLRSAPGVLLGNEAAAPRLRLLEPVGVVVRTPTPTFRWTAIADATYVVSVFDANYNEAFSSGPLRKPMWTIPVALQHGQSYRWQLTVTDHGRESRFPLPPQPEAKFQVIASEKEQRVRAIELSYANSPLILGSAYLQAGLLEEAAGQFEQVAAVNPQSTSMKTIRSSLRARR